ncbi:MAG: hypothetical protein IKR48_01740 [Kiritimatiellae bacterium]|nr:hypothetical protein [Kiritimatiellia bacterium]
MTGAEKMLQTKLNREYGWRIAGIGALMLAVCVWSIYDGKISYPRENSILEKARPFLLEQTNTVQTANGWLDSADGTPSALQAVFSRAEVQASVPKKLIQKLGDLRLPDHITNEREKLREALNRQIGRIFNEPIYSDTDLITQYIQAAITGLLGIFAFLWLGYLSRRSYRLDGEQLTGNGFGRDATIAEIQRIDWQLWKAKGIVTLYLPDRKVKLDAWHFAGVKEIVAEIVRLRPELDDTSHAS